MKKHKKLSARILSIALSVAMMTTTLPATVFAAKGDMPLGTSSVGGSDIGTIQSFDKLEDRFIPSVGKDAPSHVYGLSVALDTPAEDLNLPDELTAKVARTTTVPAEDEAVEDSGKPSEPAEDETIPDEDVVVPDGDEATDETVSGNEPASRSEAKKEVKEEIKDDDVLLAFARSQDEEAVTTTVKSETIPVTWNSDKEYKSDVNGKFVYTAEISEEYILADGVELPQIYVMVGRQARAIIATITVEVNGGIIAGGATLQAAIEASGVTLTDVTELKITAGEVTENDWKYLRKLTALTNFEIDSSIDNVANIPDARGSRIFPKSIVSVTVLQAITIGESAFDSTALTTASFPKATSIGERVFYQCTALTTANFPEAISIGEYAFNECTALTSASFPKAISIGGNAFYGCTALTSASFPEATNIGRAAFYGCTALTSASFPAATSTGEYAFSGCTALTSASFPAATSTGEYAFSGCTALTTASFPKAISIGEAAFDGCTALTSLTLGATPPASVGENVFTNCPATRSLGYVNADGNDLTGAALTAAQAAYKAATADGSGTDDKWYGWTIIGVPKITVTAKINGTDKDFSGASLQAILDDDKANITELKITAGEVTEDDWNYLKNLTALTTFEIDSSIDDDKVADIPDGSIIGINPTSIFPKSIVTVTVPQEIIIGKYAFYRCASLTDASFPKATSIGDNAFNGCAALISASFPEVTRTGETAFFGCTALTSASFPNAKTISRYAFYNCTQLATLTLPATPPATVGDKAFTNCPATRSLGYVNADGNDLTGTALTDAQAAYKADTADGSGTDDKWYGWTIVAVAPPTPPSGGGGSSSGQSIRTSVPPAYTGGTKIIGNVRVPDYTVEGAWSKNENGTWIFAGNGGQTYVNTWAPIYNPYADLTKGQSAFDWFMFDANGNMMTGWYTDANGSTYYLNPNSDNTLGAMKTGWVIIDGKHYYFNEMPDGTRGKLFKNTRTPDGYLVDENGVWDGSEKQ